MPSVLGSGVLLGVALAGAQYGGGAIFSQRSDPDEDKFAKREEVRRRFRRPVNELINEIGEGRGKLSHPDEHVKDTYRDTYRDAFDGHCVHGPPVVAAFSLLRPCLLVRC